MCESTDQGLERKGGRNRSVDRDVWMVAGKKQFGWEGFPRHYFTMRGRLKHVSYHLATLKNEAVGRFPTSRVGDLDSLRSTVPKVVQGRHQYPRSNIAINLVPSLS